MSKSRPPDILKKSHRHVLGDERAQAKEALRHDLREIDDEEAPEEEQSAKKTGHRPLKD